MNRNILIVAGASFVALYALGRETMKAVPGFKDGAAPILTYVEVGWAVLKNKLAGGSSAPMPVGEA